MVNVENVLNSHVLFLRWNSSICYVMKKNPEFILKHISLFKALMWLCFEKGWSQSTLTSPGR